MQSSPWPRVAIVGGGPGGLTLARLLSQSNISVTVFERSASPDARLQRGTVELFHTDDERRVLQEAGLWPQVEQAIQHEPDDFVLVDEEDTCHMEFLDCGLSRPELDRAILMNILLASVPAGLIRWGSEVRGVQEGGVVQLDTGDEGGFDLIVGADGAWSKVRPQLSSATPQYAGVSGIDMRFHDADNTHPEISELLGRGTFFALGEGKFLLAGRKGDGSVRVYAWGKRPENWIVDCGIDFGNVAEAKMKIAQDYDGWAPSLQQLITKADDDIIPRALYMLPTDHQWDPKPGFTLLGDAAHLMTPFGGEGVNLALLDALELSQQIISVAQSEGTPFVEKKEALYAAVRRYEVKMFKRSSQAAVETLDAMEHMIVPNAAGVFKEWLEEIMCEDGRLGSDSFIIVS